MKSAHVRSKGVNETLAMPLPAVIDRRQDVFEELYRSSRDDVYAYVATLLGDLGAAEDVTALAFERAYRRRATFRAERGSRRAWLFGIARNAALDELRRRKRVAPLFSEPAGTDDRADARIESADSVLRRATVRAALRSLGGRDRDLIALKFHAGLSNGEIARVLGTSETNAGTALHRSITKLRKACDENA
jgi:RNA polymerase sigma-70 factor (ECF subfamily)